MAGVKPGTHAPDLSTIQEPVLSALTDVQNVFLKAVETELVQMNEVSRHLLLQQGKKLRPTLLLLAARLGGPVTEPAIKAAAAVELIHTATLLHDDVIDENWIRRGMPTVNAKWNNHLSLILGDYLYSRAFVLLTENELWSALDVLSRATHQMSQGEMLQILRTDHLDLSEDEYYSFIEDKTASLIAGACSIGARLGGVNVEALDRFGKHLGIAFQIVDDLLDFTADEGEFGKPVGSDFRVGKVTLPLISALRNAPPRERESARALLRTHESLNGSWNEVLAFIGRYGGIEYTVERARFHGEEAKKSLAVFGDLPGRESLEMAVDFVTSRRH
ncbi:MAG: polyprenyl synthetase family protein [bacterium]